MGKRLRTNQLFHNGGRYHIETSPLICRAIDFIKFQSFLLPTLFLLPFSI